MHIIDRYAYTNRIRGVDPAYKVGLAVITLLLCLILNKPLVGILSIGWMFFLAVGVAELPAVVFGRVLLAEFTFLALTTVGVALSVTAKDPAAINLWATKVGPLWFSTSPEALNLALVLLTRALGGTSAMNFLAMTTPLVDLLDFFRRLRVPNLLIDIMTVMYRFIFVLLESAETMYVAQKSRLGYRSFYRSVHSAGLLASRLFIDTYRRAHRLQTAMEARSYDGEFRVLPSAYQQSHTLVLIGVMLIGSLLLVWGIS